MPPSARDQRNCLCRSRVPFALGRAAASGAIHDWISAHTSGGHSSGTSGGGTWPRALGMTPVTISSSTTPKLQGNHELC